MLRALLLLACVLAGLPASASAERCWLLDRPGARTVSPQELREHPPAFAFPVGERLEWSVRYFGIEIGRATVEVARFVRWQGRRMAHVVATARTNAFFSLFYRVDDRSEAWIDADRLVTLETATHTRHGRDREIYEEVHFDWRTHYVSIQEVRRYARDGHNVAFDFGAFVHDTFDALYALRAGPLAPGTTRELPVYASQKIYGLRVDVAASGPVHTSALGEVPAVMVRPYNTLDGKRQDDGRGLVWVSADPRHIPLRTRGWLRSSQGLHIGGLYAELVAYDPGQPMPLRTGAKAPTAISWPEASLPETRKGRPLWQPPAALREARRRAGTHPDDRRFAFTWPAQGVGCPPAEPAPPPGRP